MAEMLARISDGTPIPLFVIDSQHNVTYWNTAIEALSGIERGEIIGTSEQCVPSTLRRGRLWPI